MFLITQYEKQRRKRTMRKTIAIFSVSAMLLFARGPIGNLGMDFFGGGIGPSGTYMMLDVSSIFPNELGEFNLNPFDGKMIYMQGVEGYGHVTENYRLGAIFSLGGVSTAATDAGGIDYRAEFNLSLVGGLFEAVYPLGRNLEISVGSIVGIGKASFIRQSDTGVNPTWEDPVASGYDSRSSNYWVLQPYISAKYQFLDRMGLRLSTGYNVSKVEAGAWILNGEDRINNSPQLDLNAVFARATVYLGI